MPTDRTKDGKFVKGNSGKPKGAKSLRLKQWDALGESIIGQQAEEFNNFLNELWNEPSTDKKMAAAELYLKTLEYFKPKLTRSDVNQKNLHEFSSSIVIEKTYQKDDN